MRDGLRVYQSMGAPCRAFRDSWTIPLVVAFMLTACLTGCNVDVQDGVGPRVPFSNVGGVVKRIERDGDNLRIVIRVPDTEEEEVVASTVTDDDGEFQVAVDQPGEWEIKVSGDEVGDFDSVTREFLIEDLNRFYEIPTMDIWAYGAAMLTPGVETVEKPTPSNPLVFRFTLPDAELEWARVQIFEDDSWIPVWISDKSIEEEILWDGIGNQGEFADSPVPWGIYSWRMKFGFHDGLEARLARWRFFFPE